MHGLDIQPAPGEEIGQRHPFRRSFRMQREVHPLDLHPMLVLQLLNTHGTEIAPRSDIVGEDLHRHGLGHRDASPRWLCVASAYTVTVERQACGCRAPAAE